MQVVDVLCQPSVLPWPVVAILWVNVVEINTDAAFKASWHVFPIHGIPHRRRRP